MCVCVLLHRGGVVNQSLRSRRTPGEWGSAVRKAKRALLLESCLAFFMAHPSSFVGNMHISELQPCLPKTVYCGHVVVLAPRGTTADTSLSCNNSYPSKSSWLQYINPLFFMSVDRLADVFNIQAETVNDETNLDLWSFVGEDLPSPEPVLLPQHTSAAGGRGRLNPRGKRRCHKGLAPNSPAPILDFWAVSLDVWLDRESKKKTKTKKQTKTPQQWPQF